MSRRALAAAGAIGLAAVAWSTKASQPGTAGQHQVAVAPVAARESGETPRVPRRRLERVRPVVLLGGTLLDGTGAEPLRDAVVVVEGGLIQFAGSRDQIVIPPRAVVLDVTGSTILPGFINAHVHCRYQVDRLRAWAQAGVTTVRDLGGPRTYDLVARQNGDPQLARVVAAGPFITVPGGYPIVPWGSTNAVTVRTPDEARSAVAQLAGEGAGVIKIALECGQDFGRVIPSLDAAEAAAVVSEAHARGLGVSVHLTVSVDVPRAVAAGVDDIAHMPVTTLSLEMASQVAAHGIVWVPTLELWHWVGYGHKPAAISNLARFLAAGGEVAMGTDFGGYDAEFELGMPMIEIDAMRQAGMSPAAIIQAATRNGARVCGLGDRLGTVEAGKTADLLVVRGDPLADLEALTDVRLVMHSGVVIRDEGPPAATAGRT
ncbi:MAG: amidohydrolase family protein [Thermoanaerobaculaceae bacterium]|nr:amidohydrolase family protein [Thermoanaerobaculaceae bacterium]